MPDSDNIAAVTVFLGANDASLKDRNPKQHVPLEDYIENLTWLTNRYCIFVRYYCLDQIFDLDPSIDKS